MKNKSLSTHPHADRKLDGVSYRPQNISGCRRWELFYNVKKQLKEDITCLQTACPVKLKPQDPKQNLKICFTALLSQNLVAL